MDCTKNNGACSSGGCATSGTSAESTKDSDNELRERMGRIKHKILVLSGKGGVGKSTVAANVACALSLKKFRTGLLDVDFHGPSIPTLLNLEGKSVYEIGRAHV